MYYFSYFSGSISIQSKIGLFCSPYDGAVLSSGTKLTIVMTTNEDLKTGIGFLATATAGKAVKWSFN